MFLFVLPAPFRGFQHNVAELKTWYQGMVGSSSEKGFGQRDEQNWSWVNQSIIAMTHRLTRPVNYNQDDPAKPARTMNIANLDFKTANWIVLAISLAIGLGYLAVMPPASRRTERSDAEELGILFCLMTVASPLARQYYFMWLFFPITVLAHRAAYDPRPAVRAGTWALLAVAGGLLCLSLPLFPIDLQAYGNNLAATILLAAGLVWHILHPPAADAALPQAAGELQLDANNNAHSQGIDQPCPTHKLQPVLDHIDADFDNSLERLFALLRIKSISADPAFAGDCKAAADHLAKDIATLGFKAEVQADGRASRDRRQSQWQHRRPAACAVLRPLRCAAGRSAQSVAPSAVRACRHRPRRRPQDHRRARRRGRQGTVDDLRRGLPRLEDR